MRSSGSTKSARLCPACAAAEMITGAETLWPSGWRCKACGYEVEVNDGIPLYAPDLANARTGFDTAVFDEFARHEAGHFWFEPRSRLLAGLANKFFPEAGRYLEIGCGTGVVLKAMAATRLWARLAGSELHPAGLFHAIRRLGDQAEFVQMDARRIPARATFDLIGAFDVLEHILEDENVMREVHAALVPGGGFIASVPQHPALWSQADIVAHHVRRYRRGELERKLRSAQFEILFSSSYSSVVLPLMAVSRFIRRRPASDKIVVHELNVHPILNTILRRALDAEVSFTLKGMAWPLGGSRIVVARKSRAP
jgi:SAM-dependent methyltransferase